MTDHEFTIPPEMAAHFDWLRDPEVRALLDCLNQDGFVTRVVGGAVRNSLLGLPVNDIDLATTALPEQVVERAELFGLKVVPTGIEHGTVTVIVMGTPFEVTTLRRDRETDGRHATVDYTSSWAEDAARRDFTINAIGYDLHRHEIEDPYGGESDLSNGILKQLW